MLISTNRKKGIKSKIDIELILTNHYFHAQNLSVKNRENNGVLAGVPFLSPSRAQIPPSPSDEFCRKSPPIACLADPLTYRFK